MKAGRVMGGIILCAVVGGVVLWQLGVLQPLLPSEWSSPAAIYEEMTGTGGAKVASRPIPSPTATPREYTGVAQLFDLAGKSWEITGDTLPTAPCLIENQPDDKAAGEQARSFTATHTNQSKKSF